MNIWFQNEDISRSTMNEKSIGVITPMKDVTEAESKLKGFTWEYDRRPKSKQDLLTETKKNLPKKPAK
jgi:hypothetical protein